jgi:hypothetical protein
MGLVYRTLALALDRGRVTVVARRTALPRFGQSSSRRSSSGRSEPIGRTLVFAAVVAGGALIGASR